MARPNAYQTKIKPRFDEIEKWLKLGASEKEIIKNLGVSDSTYFKYKASEMEFMEFLKKGRRKPVEDIKAAMLKRAIGFQFEEKKVVTQRIVIDGVNDEKIPAKVIRTETTTKTALPDVAAGLVLLQHWDKEQEWSRDPANLKLKKQELEFKKEQAENEAW